MSRENVEVIDGIRRSFEAFNRRDIDAAMEGMHTEVEWPNMLEGTTIRGHDAIRKWSDAEFVGVGVSLQVTGDVAGQLLTQDAHLVPQSLHLAAELGHRFR
jgi:ketosteroid isomerase-like protein